MSRLIKIGDTTIRFEYIEEVERNDDGVTVRLVSGSIHHFYAGVIDYDTLVDRWAKALEGETTEVRLSELPPSIAFEGSYVSITPDHPLYEAVCRYTGDTSSVNVEPPRDGWRMPMPPEEVLRAMAQKPPLPEHPARQTFKGYPEPDDMRHQRMMAEGRDDIEAEVFGNYPDDRKPE